MGYRAHVTYLTPKEFRWAKEFRNYLSHPETVRTLLRRGPHPDGDDGPAIVPVCLVVDEALISALDFLELESPPWRKGARRRAKAGAMGA